MSRMSGRKKNNTVVMIAVLAIAIVIVISASGYIMTMFSLSSIGANPIQATVTEGTTSIRAGLSFDILYSSSDPEYQILLDFMGDWDSYMSPHKTLPDTYATLSTKYFSTERLVGSETITDLPLKCYFYGNYDATNLCHVQSGATLNFPVSTTTINFDFEISSMIYFSGSAAVRVYKTVIKPKYSLIISTTSGGTTQPAPNTYTKEKGSSVTVTAVPSGDYSFDSWKLNGVSKTANPISFNIESDTTLHAIFKAGEPEPEPTPPPQITNIWDTLQSIWTSVWDWLKTIFGLQVTVKRLEIVTGDIAYANDIYEHTFILQNKRTVDIPDSDYTDGTASYAYALWMVTDSGGNIIYKGDVVDASLAEMGAIGDTGDVAMSWQIPSDLPSGKYVVSAILLEVPMHWDGVQEKWIQDKAIVIDKQAEELNVRTVILPVAPSSTNIWNQIEYLWQNLIAWFQSLFSWFKLRR